MSPKQASIVSNGEARGISEESYRLILQYAASYAEQVQTNPDLHEEESVEEAEKVDAALAELRRD